MNKITVGLASGLGNAVFMLPAIRALKERGNHVSLFIETDFATTDLFRRCVYADEIIERKAQLNGNRLICGNWMPQSWRGMNHTRYQLPFPYTMPEWESNLQIAGAGVRDVSDWCAGVEHSDKYDIGIVPGSKGGVWLRKRWPGMAALARHYIDQGKRVAVFGLDSDGVQEIPGEHIETSNIATLPDALAQCRVIVGTDSGVSHLASSLGIPVVMVFTATSEIKGQPIGPHRVAKLNILCRPCQTTPRYQDCQDWKCREIEINSVIEAVGSL